MVRIVTALVIACCCCSCSVFNKTPPRALIVKPQLERVQQGIDKTDRATERVVEKVEIVRDIYPDDTNVQELVALAKDARTQAAAVKKEYEAIVERVSFIEEQNIALEERAFQAERDIGKFKTKLANWRLVAFLAIGSTVLVSVLWIRPWRYL